MQDWQPDQYLKFEAQREVPAYDLLGMVEPVAQMRALDLGCGTGRLTARFADHLGTASMLGVDQSRAMLAECAAYASELVSFRQAEISQFRDEQPYDLIISNAALQWLPDHPSLFAQLASMLRPRGQLAVQMPDNYDAVAHVTAAELAPQFGMRALKRPVYDVEDYARLLYSLGFVEQRVLLKVYPHVLESSEAILEWVKGSLLGFYRQQLDPPAYRSFEEEYRRVLLERLGDQQPCFYPFKRILFWARRAS